MNKKEFNVRYLGVEVLSKTMLPSPDDQNIIQHYHFELTVDTKASSESGLLVVIVQVGIRQPDSDIILATVRVGNSFEVVGFADLPEVKGENPKIPADLDIFLRTIAISTSRGIIHGEFKGTYLFNALLPIIVIPTSNTPIVS